METEENLQEEISRVEALYSAANASNAQKEQSIAHEEELLAQLQQRIDSIQVVHTLPDLQSAKADLDSLTLQLQNLNKGILHADEQLTKSTSSFNSSLQAARQNYINLLEQSKISNVISYEEYDQLQTELSRIQKAVSDEHALLDQSKALAASTSSEINEISLQLQRILATQNEVDESIKGNQSHSQSELLSLAREVQILEKQLSNYDEETAKAIQETSTQNVSLKQSNEAALHQLNKQKVKQEELKLQSKQLKHSIQEQTKKQSEIQRNSSHLSANLLKVEQQIKENESQIQNLKKRAQNLKEEIKQQDQRIKEEQRKTQKQKNPRELINAAKTENERLSRQRDRDQNILENSIKSRSTYVNKESLEILQRELSRQQNPKALSLDGKTAQSQKLKWRNKQLKDNIKRLKRLSEEAEAREAKILNEASKKKDQLVKDKLEIDKQVTQATFKLNEYTKKFPNHDQEKEERRKAKMKKTDSLVVEASPKRKKKDKQLQEDETEFIILQDTENEKIHVSAASDQFKQTKWYKRRSSDDHEYEPEKPLYQNRYLQAAGLLLFILVVSIISS